MAELTKEPENKKPEHIKYVLTPEQNTACHDTMEAYLNKAQIKHTWKESKPGKNPITWTLEIPSDAEKKFKTCMNFKKIHVNDFKK